MREIEVALTPDGVEFWEGEDLSEKLTPSEFDWFAEQVAETRRNKAGRSTVTCETQHAQIGDFIFGLEIVNVRPSYPTPNITTLNTKPFGWMIFDNDLVQTFERSIS